MSDEENGYHALIVVYLVDETVVFDTEAPTFTVLEFTTSCWTGFFD